MEDIKKIIEDKIKLILSNKLEKDELIKLLEELSSDFTIYPRFAISDGNGEIEDYWYRYDSYIASKKIRYVFDKDDNYEIIEEWLI